MILVGLGYRKRSGKDTVGEYLVKRYGFQRVAFADPLKQAAMAIFGFTYEQCYGSDEHKEAIDPRWGFSPRQALQKLGNDLRQLFVDDIWVKSAEASIQKALKGEANTKPWKLTNEYEFVSQSGPMKALGMSDEQTRSLLRQRVGNILHVTAGSDSWEPTDEELTRIAQLFANADDDPHGAVVVTRDGITVDEVRQPVNGVVITDVRYPNEAEMIRRNGGLVFRVDRPSLGPSTDTHPSETAMQEFAFDGVITNDGSLEQLYAAIDDLMITLELRE